MLAYVYFTGLQPIQLIFLIIFRFPLNDKDKLERWEKAVRRIDKKGKRWQATSCSFICSEHFKKEDYITAPGLSSRCKLKPDATPTIFEKFPTHLKPKEPSFSRPGVKRKLPTPSPSPAKILRIHSYAKPPCGDIGHEGQNEGMVKDEEQRVHTEKLALKNAMLERKVKTLQQRVRRRNVKIKNMTQLIDELKEKLLIKTEEASLLHNNFDGLQLSMFRNTLQNAQRLKQGKRYTETVKEFAITLYFYSPRAYNFVRGLLSLPHPSMIRKWSASIDCEPGFISEAFHSLAKIIESSPEKKDCALMLDGMAIRKQVIYDPKKDQYVGFINYGGAVVEPSEELASEALAFLLVGLRGHWKCPIGYFLINKMSANVQKQLVRIALTKAAEAGLRVHCVTCDGTTTNISMFEGLGCSFCGTYDTMKTTFKHPTEQYDVSAILDPCHMLKLARNSLADLSCFLAPDGSRIEWKYFKNLHDLQENQGLKLAKKLGSSHLNYQKNKMKVSLAAQTLSSSVADAFEFLRDGLRMEQFASCAPTVKFVRLVDRLFDILNSRNPVARGFKQPLRLATQERWTAVLKSTAEYLLALKASNGQLLRLHRRKTFVLGFVMTIKSTIVLANSLLQCPLNPFKFLLTYKFSQDHIELLFSCIRSKGGWNNNPNVLQFKYALRSMLLRNKITASNSANRQIFEQNAVIPVFSGDSFETSPTVANLEVESELESENILRQLDTMQHTLYIDNILYYISGFIVAKLIKKINCQSCKESLLGDVARSDHTYCPGYDEVHGPAVFTSFVNNGGLTIPSPSVFKVVACAEKVFKVHVCKEKFCF